MSIFSMFQKKETPPTKVQGEGPEEKGQESGEVESGKEKRALIESIGMEKQKKEDLASKIIRICGGSENVERKVRAVMSYATAAAVVLIIGGTSVGCKVKPVEQKRAQATEQAYQDLTKND